MPVEATRCRFAAVPIPVSADPLTLHRMPVASATAASSERSGADSTRRTLTYVAFGVGAAGLVAGGAAGVVWLAARKDLRAECPTSDTCPPSASDTIDRYQLFGYISGAGFAAGLIPNWCSTALFVTFLAPNCDGFDTTRWYNFAMWFAMT